MNEYGAREDTRAFQNDRENQLSDVAKWPCNHLTFLEAAKLLVPSPQESDAIAKMEKDLMAKLERANKIDRLREELRQKAEELRQAQLAEAWAGVSHKLTDSELDEMLDKMNRDYMAAKQAEEGTESRAYPQRPNIHE